MAVRNQKFGTPVSFSTTSFSIIQNPTLRDTIMNEKKKSAEDTNNGSLGKYAYCASAGLRRRRSSYLASEETLQLLLQEGGGVVKSRADRLENVAGAGSSYREPSYEEIDEFLVVNNDNRHESERNPTIKKEPKNQKGSPCPLASSSSTAENSSERNKCSNNNPPQPAPRISLQNRSVMPSTSSNNLNGSRRKFPAENSSKNKPKPPPVMPKPKMVNSRSQHHHPPPRSHPPPPPKPIRTFAHDAYLQSLAEAGEIKRKTANNCPRLVKVRPVAAARSPQAPPPPPLPPLPTPMIAEEDEEDGVQRVSQSTGGYGHIYAVLEPKEETPPSKRSMMQNPSNNYNNKKSATFSIHPRYSSTFSTTTPLTTHGSSSSTESLDRFSQIVHHYRSSENLHHHSSSSSSYYYYDTPWEWRADPRDQQKATRRTDMTNQNMPNVVLSSTKRISRSSGDLDHHQHPRRFLCEEDQGDSETNSNSSTSDRWSRGPPHPYEYHLDTVVLVGNSQFFSRTKPTTKPHRSPTAPLPTTPTTASLLHYASTDIRDQTFLSDGRPRASSDGVVLTNQQQPGTKNTTAVSDHRSSETSLLLLLGQPMKKSKSDRVLLKRQKQLNTALSSVRNKFRDGVGGGEPADNNASNNNRSENSGKHHISRSTTLPFNIGGAGKPASSSKPFEGAYRKKPTSVSTKLRRKARGVLPQSSVNSRYADQFNSSDLHYDHQQNNTNNNIPTTSTSPMTTTTFSTSSPDNNGRTDSKANNHNRHISSNNKKNNAIAASYASPSSSSSSMESLNQAREVSPNNTTKMKTETNGKNSPSTSAVGVVKFRRKTSQSLADSEVREEMMKQDCQQRAERAILIRRKTRTKFDEQERAFLAAKRDDGGEGGHLFQLAANIRLELLSSLPEAQQNEIRITMNGSPINCNRESFYVPVISSMYPSNISSIKGDSISTDLNVLPYLVYPDFTHVSPLVGGGRSRSVQQQQAEAVTVTSGNYAVVGGGGGSGASTSQEFIVTITNEKSERRFVYCIRYYPQKEGFAGEDSSSSSSSDDSSTPSTGDNGRRSKKPIFPEVLCILSPIQSPSLYMSLLREILKIKPKLRRQCLQALYRKEFPQQGIGFPLDDVPGIELGTRPIVTNSGVPLGQQGAARLLKRLKNVNYAIDAFTALLCEKRVLIAGDSISSIASAIQSFVSFLYPFEWPFTLIPVIPDSLVESCRSPSPYLIGCIRSNLHQLRDILANEEYSEEEFIFIMDLDYGILRDTDYAILNAKPKMANVPESRCLPRKIREKLEEELMQIKIGLDRLKNEDEAALREADSQISRAFMFAIIALIGHSVEYTVPQQDGKFTFAKSGFLSYPRSKSTRFFLKWFSETMLFQYWLEKRLKDLNRQYLTASLKSDGAVNSNTLMLAGAEKDDIFHRTIGVMRREGMSYGDRKKRATPSSVINKNSISDPLYKFFSFAFKIDDSSRYD